jgi:hypothetical protein
VDRKSRQLVERDELEQWPAECAPAGDPGQRRDDPDQYLWSQHGGSMWGQAPRAREVNIADLGILAANWQSQIPESALGFEEALAMFDVFDGVVVPEAGVAGLLLGFGVLGLRRRR